MNGRFISYLRVSTDRQGRSGLGLDAQREAVKGYLNGGRWTLVAEYVETESGKKADRPELQKALTHCRVTGATLLVAKLDRLARNVAFMSSLMEAGVDFVAVDFPQANRLTLHILAAVAEHEAAMISQRTKDALAQAKARGVVMGGFRGVKPDAAKATKARIEAADAFAQRVGPMVQAMRAEGVSLNQIAAKLAQDGVMTPRGGQWTATTVKNLLARL